MEVEPAGQSGRDARSQVPNEYQMEEDRIQEMVRACYEEGILPTNIDPGVMEVNGKEVKFILNRSLDEVKVKWLKGRTVTVIFRDGARFLPKKVKEDVIRAYEDVWISGATFGPDFRRGRIKVESPNVVSYVPRAQEITDWMLAKGSDYIDLPNVTYRTESKPWMTRAEMRGWRKLVDQNVFWVVAVGVPLDKMLFTHVHVERAIGKIVKAHTPKADASDPKLVNLRFNIDPASKDNMKDKIEVQTHQGDVLEVRLASAESEWCRRCRTFFHTEDTCRRQNQRRQGENSTSPLPGSTRPGLGGGRRQSYSGTLQHPGMGLQSPAASATATSTTAAVMQPGGTGSIRVNPVFSPGPGLASGGAGVVQPSPSTAPWSQSWAAFLQGIPTHPFVAQQAQPLPGQQLVVSPSFVNMHSFIPWLPGTQGYQPQQVVGVQGLQGLSHQAPPPRGGSLARPTSSRARGESPGKQRRISEGGGIDIEVDQDRGEELGSLSEGSLHSLRSEDPMSGTPKAGKRKQSRSRMNALSKG
ncbi:hypothetical protein CBR_g74636 [Chara braunii]|uniref:Uncharacterized protein n=1 Tax=Chara braunii TaxID=69332 RepID=A0A388KA97_CHABU|nr:hypothetical protein CBR_g74636 [Chara braunii]|eukprot:GBG66949.1 hypothetical protein CBR_g74636 [Chara braunii]